MKSMITGTLPTVNVFDTTKSNIATPDDDRFANGWQYQDKAFCEYFNFFWNETSTSLTQMNPFVYNLNDEISQLVAYVKSLDSSVQFDTAENNWLLNVTKYLKGLVDTEATNRDNADTALSNSLITKIETETANRQSAISALETSLTSKITAEETARKAADATLQNNINTEATNRANADSTINENLATTRQGLFPPVIAKQIDLGSTITQLRYLNEVNKCLADGIDSTGTWKIMRVLCNNSGTVELFSSTDGVTWSKVNATFSNKSFNKVTKIHYSPYYKCWFMTGCDTSNKGLCMTSQNGTNWYEETSFSSSKYSYDSIIMDIHECSLGIVICGGARKSTYATDSYDGGFAGYCSFSLGRTWYILEDAFYYYSIICNEKGVFAAWKDHQDNETTRGLRYFSQFPTTAVLLQLSKAEPFSDTTLYPYFRNLEYSNGYAFLPIWGSAETANRYYCVWNMSYAPSAGNWAIKYFNYIDNGVIKESIASVIKGGCLYTVCDMGDGGAVLVGSLWSSALESQYIKPLYFVRGEMFEGSQRQIVLYDNETSGVLASIYCCKNNPDKTKRIFIIFDSSKTMRVGFA